MENREIKFRAKSIDKNEWVYGSFIGILSPYKEYDEWIEGFIHEGLRNIKWAVAINLKTVGQFTGLKDKEGKEIYEGDVVESIDEDGYGGTTEYQEVVEYGGGAFNPISAMPSDQYKIIGNIYSNPELIN